MGDGNLLLTEVKEFQSTLDERLNRVGKRMDQIEAMANMPVGTSGTASEDNSLAARVWGSDEFKSWASRGGKGRLLLSVPLEAKTTITSTAVGSSTPGILVPQRVPGIVSPGIRKVRVRDLIPQYPTSNNAVEFVKENSYTDAASPVAEASDKPESALNFTIDFEPVRTIAHWIPASRQIMDDFTELRSYLDQRLMQGLLDVEDQQILTGDGAGQHLNGFTMEASAYDTTRNKTGDTYLDKLNHAISQIEDVNLTPSGVILHPRDWRAIQLTKTEPGGPNTGEYLTGGPINDAPKKLWDLDIATSTAVTPGKFFVGAFQTHTALWVRLALVVDISAEHSDFFVKNLLAVRCEERIALTVFRSDAVVYGSFV